MGIRRMSLIAANDIIRIALQWFSDGVDEQVNVHHFKVDDVGAGANDLDFMTQLATLLLDELYDDVANEIADNILGSIMTGQNITQSTTLPPVVNPIDGLATGTDAYARQITGLVYMNTNVSRRQGRSYLPAFVENAVADNGAWASGALSAMLSYASKLTLPITDGDMIVHRVVTHPDGSSPIEISFAGVSAYPRTQRRRTPGFGS